MRETLINGISGLIKKAEVFLPFTTREDTALKKEKKN